MMEIVIKFIESNKIEEAIQKLEETLKENGIFDEHLIAITTIKSEHNRLTNLDYDPINNHKKFDEISRLILALVRKVNKNQKESKASISSNHFPRINANSKLKELIADLFRDKDYHENLPFPLGDILKAFDLNEESDDYKENRHLGNSRARLVRKYYYNFLDICRFSILSILWDEIEEGIVNTPKPEIDALLIPEKNVSAENIQTLRKLCDEIIDGLGHKAEFDFILKLIPSLESLEKCGHFFGNYTYGSVDHNYYKECESLLGDLIRGSHFLTDYIIKSFYSRYYYRYRTDSEHRYKVEIQTNDSFFNANLFPEKEIHTNFVCIQSVYLCLQASDDVVINLSPFYFDKNITSTKEEEEEAKAISTPKINLYVLEKYNRLSYGQGLGFVFKPVFSPEFTPDIKNTRKNHVLISGIPSIDGQDLSLKQLHPQLTRFKKILSKKAKKKNG